MDECVTQMALLNEWHRFLLSVAGHTQHEMTSATAFESVFKYLEEMRLKSPEGSPAVAKKRRHSDEEEEEKVEEVKMVLDQSDKVKDVDEVEPKDEPSVIPRLDEANTPEKVEPEKGDVPEDNAKKEEL